MLNKRVKPGFVTLHVHTQVVGHPLTAKHIALNAYINGNVRCSAQNEVREVQIVVQGQVVWVAPESLTDNGNPIVFDFVNRAA